MVNKTVVNETVVNKTVVNKTLLEPPAQAPSQRCYQCGGSGMLRLSDQRFRTCLECLGQGKPSPISGAITTADVLQGQLPRQLPKQSAQKPQRQVNAVGFSSDAK